MVLPSALIQDGLRTPTQTESSTEAPNTKEPKSNQISREAEGELTKGSIPLETEDKAAAVTDEVEIEDEDEEEGKGEKATELARQPAAEESREADDENGDWYIERSSVVWIDSTDGYTLE